MNRRGLFKAAISAVAGVLSAKAMPGIVAFHPPTPNEVFTPVVLEAKKLTGIVYAPHLWIVSNELQADCIVDVGEWIDGELEGSLI